MKPKKLKGGEACVAYDATAPQLPLQSQTITIYPRPLFMFSPRMKVYAADDIVRVVGYLSRFEPAEDEDGQPTMTLTMTITPPEGLQ